MSGSEKLTSEAAQLAEDKLTPRQKRVAEEITKWFAMGGVSLIAVDPYDGAILIKTAARHAELIVRAARHDKRVWDILEKLTQSSDLFALLTFEMFFVYALIAHHNPTMPKNEPLLVQFGYHEAQVLAEFQGASNGYGANGTV